MNVLDGRFWSNQDLSDRSWLGTSSVFGVDWVIVGGESGSYARPCSPAWVERVALDCQSSDIPVFVKQLGTVWAREFPAKDRKGGDPSEWPQSLQIRQWCRGPL